MRHTTKMIPILSMEDGFHSRVTIQVVNLSQNRLTHVTGKLSATKLLTELRLGSNSFEDNLTSYFLKIDRLKKLIFCKKLELILAR